MHGPAWADTLLIWTYDEHGGYYDHVPPPPAVPPDDVPGRSLVAHPSALRILLKALFPGYVRHAEQLVAGPGAYDTCGFRVPAVIVSPYARRDFVLSDVLDHTVTGLARGPSRWPAAPRPRPARPTGRRGRRRPR